MMDQSKALHRLREVADLVGMIEDLLDPARTESLSAASWSGMRTTLRGVRESMIESHAVLTRDLVQRARTAAQSSTGESASAQSSANDRAVKATQASQQPKFNSAHIQRQTLSETVERISSKE